MGTSLTKAKDNKVGEGTFATVCVVADKTEPGHAYALKRLKRNSSVEDEKLFNKEIDILGSMDHGYDAHRCAAAVHTWMLLCKAFACGAHCRCRSCVNPCVLMLPICTISNNFRNIVAFKGTGTLDESQYLMQEYIAGGVAFQSIIMYETTVQSLCLAQSQGH